jgi:hypothetical protein
MIVFYELIFYFIFEGHQINLNYAFRWGIRESQKPEIAHILKNTPFDKSFQAKRKFWSNKALS